MTEVIPFQRSVLIYALIMLSWKPLILYLNGVYERDWVVAGSDAMLVLGLGVAQVAIIELSLAYLVVMPSHWMGAGFPRSIPLLNVVLTAFLLPSTRFLTRISYDMKNGGSRKNGKAVLIVGAGMVGSMIVRELLKNPVHNLSPIGYLDDNVNKEGLSIHNIPVLGPLSRLESVVRHYKVQEVIIAIPSAPGSLVRAIDEACKRAGVKSKTVPGMSELVAGTASVTQLRDIQIEDLLRRGVVKSDTTPVMRLLAGKRVMVTGAGGSIGSELCRQIIAAGPAELVLMGHGENSIFGIANELRNVAAVKEKEILLHAVIADMRDEERMEKVFIRHRPEIIFHAAAHKHVGLMEANLPDAVSNNVHGTRTIVNLAVKRNVERFVMISSDKAVNPTCVMGVTKRVAELIVQEAALATGRPFVSVRFGNVLGSRGSVVPIFQAAVMAGGPVKVTHPLATRFFMTIPEAVQLVLQSATLGSGGEVFVLDMGKPIRILDLARDVIRLSGCKEEEIPIEFIGLAWGEKMHEELFYDWENPERSLHPKILVCRSPMPEQLKMLLSNVGISAGTLESFPEARHSRLNREIDRLIVMSAVGKKEEAVACVKRLVPQSELDGPPPNPTGELDRSVAPVLLIEKPKNGQLPGKAQ